MLALIRPAVRRIRPAALCAAALFLAACSPARAAPPHELAEAGPIGLRHDLVVVRVEGDARATPHVGQKHLRIEPRRLGVPGREPVGRPREQPAHRPDICLILFARAFTANTPQTNARAAVIMRGVYVLVLLIGAAFCVNAFAGAQIKYRVLVQAIIFLALGVGANTITIVVTAPIGPTMKTYTLTVVRPYLVTVAAASGQGSLRQAILDAESNPGPDAIVFDPALQSPA